MTDNVIPFPGKNKRLPEPSITESILFEDRSELEQDVLDIVLAELAINGYDLDTILEHQPKDLGLVVESIASLIDRYNLKPHFLQPISDHIFTSNENREILYNDAALISLDLIVGEIPEPNDIT